MAFDKAFRRALSHDIVNCRPGFRESLEL